MVLLTASPNRTASLKGSCNSEPVIASARRASSDTLNRRHSGYCCTEHWLRYMENSAKLEYCRSFLEMVCCAVTEQPGSCLPQPSQSSALDLGGHLEILQISRLSPGKQCIVSNQTNVLVGPIFLFSHSQGNMVSYKEIFLALLKTSKSEMPTSGTWLNSCTLYLILSLVIPPTEALTKAHRPFCKTTVHLFSVADNLCASLLHHKNNPHPHPLEKEVTQKKIS